MFFVFTVAWLMFELDVMKEWKEERRQSRLKLQSACRHSRQIYSVAIYFCFRTYPPWNNQKIKFYLSRFAFSTTAPSPSFTHSLARLCSRLILLLKMNQEANSKVWLYFKQQQMSTPHPNIDTIMLPRFMNEAVHKLKQPQCQLFDQSAHYQCSKMPCIHLFS